MNVMVSLSKTPMAHPPRSNPPLRSSSDAPPFPCITPWTVTCVMAVNFMVAVPFSLVGRRSVRRDHRTDLIGCGTGSALSYGAPAVYAGARTSNQFGDPPRMRGRDRLHADLARGDSSKQRRLAAVPT